MPRRRRRTTRKKKQMKMKKRKELDKLRGPAKDGNASSDDEDGDGADGAGEDKKPRRDSKAEKTAKDSGEEASKPKVSHEEWLKRRFRKLIAAVDLKTDEKLNNLKAEVRVERLSEKLSETDSDDVMERAGKRRERNSPLKKKTKGGDNSSSKP